MIPALAVTLIIWKSGRRLLFRSTIDNIPGPAPESFLKGAFDKLFDANAWDYHKKIAETYGSVMKIPTFLGDSWLYVFDPKALHHILVKEPYVFEETDSFIEGNKLLFGPGLVATLGEQHRKQRKMLNPVFSIAHLREMIPTFYDVGYKLRDVFLNKVKNGPQEIDVLHWMTRTTLELIGQGGLGVSFDSLNENTPLHEFAAAAKAVTPVTYRFTFFRNYFLATVVKLGPPQFRRLLIDLLPSSWKSGQELKNIIDVMQKTSIAIYKSKKRAIIEGDESISQQAGRGKDIMTVLMKANMAAADADTLSEDEVIGQMSTLLFASIDTTSGALSRILHVLAQHPEIQHKLREEIVEVTNNGDLDYNQLSSLPYMDAVVRETLRLYPPVSMLARTTRKDAVFPLSKPIRGLDGQEIHQVHVANNTNVIIGIRASNRNRELWGPDAEEWKPERWLNPLPDTLTEARIPGVYSHLMTFFGGGRACIGFKFAQLEIKIILALLIKSFRFSPSKEIVWQMFSISMPSTVAEDSSKSGQLPLIIERI